MKVVGLRAFFYNIRVYTYEFLSVLLLLNAMTFVMLCVFICLNIVPNFPIMRNK